MATAEEILESLQRETGVTVYDLESEVLTIDVDTRTINVPASERLFGVKGDMNIERKYFRCPKIVGDNIDLSTHQIFIAYVYTETENGSIFPTVGVAPYHCEDVEVEGEDITFSWKLTGNVFENPGFILFKMYAKKTDTDPNTVFNTTPAIGTVLATIPDGTEEIVEKYPDVIAQIFERLDALEAGGGEGGGGITKETDPTVPAWAKEPTKPTYTAAEVGADASGTADAKVSAHNMASDSHNDIRLLVQGLTTRLNALADSDDDTLDQMSEIVAYIKSNKSLIEAITTSKVNVSDIINDLITNASDKPLSAAQGVVLKSLIDGITIPEALPNPHKLKFTGAVTAEYDGSTEQTIDIPAGSGGVPSDYETVKQNAESVWVDKTLTYSIAENREEIFSAVENSKADKMSITDASEYWDATEETKYPSILSIDKLRTCRFYANMWLPNGLDMDQSYRYAVDKNGQIRLYDINGQKSDLASFLPWGMCLKGEGKSFPDTAINFVVSKIKVLGLNNKTKRWEIALDTVPNGSLYIVQQTNLETEIAYEIVRSDLENGLYKFTVQPEQWNYNNPSSQYDGGDMCFHFFGSEGILADQMKQYDKLLVCFRMAIQEEAYSDVFTVSPGGDAWGTVEMITEAFFGRFNPVTNNLTEYSSNNCLESEYGYIVNNMVYIDQLLASREGESSGGSGNYTLPVMTASRLGGGKAIQKTTQDTPVAVDENGQLWVSAQTSGSENPASSTPYDGKTIVMFGDSIVAGWGWQEGYGISRPLQEKYPLGTWENKAVSGTNMAEMTDDSKESIVASVKRYSGPADYILLEGGTNDNTNSIPIGTIQSGYDASYDETTYTGALESALQYIMDNYPLARKFFLIPHSFQKDNSYVDDFHDRAIEVCEKWNMPVLDMRKMSQIAMTEANKAIYTRNPNTNQGDGVHPTETWYRAFYSPVVDQFMRSLGEYMEISEPPENVPVTGVTLDQSSITLTSAGQVQQLIASVSPSNATNKTVTWESDHPEYATVTQNGVVQAVANGAAVITVKTQDGNKTDTCSVNVQINEEPEIDHQELAKVGLDINTYFDTEIIPDADTDFEIKARVESADISGTWIVGVRDANNKYTVSITDNWYCARGALSSAAGNTPYWDEASGWIIKTNDNVFSFNGTEIELADANDLTFTQSIYVGNVNNNGEPYTGKGFSGEIYYLKIYKSELLIADIIPVKKTDGTLCLYDKVRQKYLYNLGTGNLTE